MSPSDWDIIALTLEEWGYTNKACLRRLIVCSFILNWYKMRSPLVTAISCPAN
ncbi:hypothetical protein AB0759_37950 [Scytonema tolypothrichoides VB-61278_2]|uniref:Uncharacterized protein n=2 Tax=Nostocales TaxID=1161 RepID=A0A8S9T2I4_9CYAN|nr:hypothetical protein [Tolypothrix bouteillei]KAF3886197.1 hypothetical protein DA73_0400012475 [Tolypothrix bouteillei VB521301]